MKEQITDRLMNSIESKESRKSKRDTSKGRSFLDGLCYRNMTHADIEEIIELEKKIFSSPWTRETLQGLLKLSKKCDGLVVELKEKIIGYAVFWTVEEELHIANIAVVEEFRQRGLGRRIVDNMMQKARDSGTMYACLEVRESNRIAIQMYNNLGFQNAGIRENYYTDNDENAVLMMKLIQGV